MIKSTQFLAAQIRALGTARAGYEAVVAPIRQRLKRPHALEEPQPAVPAPPPKSTPGPLQFADELIEAHGDDAFWAASFEAIRKLKAGDKNAFYEWKKVADTIGDLEQAAARAMDEPRSVDLKQWASKAKRKRALP